MIKLDFDSSEFEQAVDEAVTEGVRGILEEKQKAARNVDCPTHGRQCSISFADFGRPEEFQAHFCCEEGKRRLFAALGVTE